MKRWNVRGWMRGLPGLSLVLLLLSAGACGDDVIVINAVDVNMEVKDLPRDVVQSVALHWPHAKIESAQHRYGNDAWNAYLLTLGFEDGRKECPVLAKDGAVQWNSGSVCHGQG
ncbi:MAG TPA: hypothetical protein VGG20_15005 [Thermoanaerobaculia bacterium]